MGLLNRAGPWLNRQMQAAATDPANETITYTRKSDGAVIDLTGKAWVGNTAFRRNASEGGAAVVWGERDYMVPLEDLAVAGVAVAPERGDLIAHTKGGTTTYFECATQVGEPEARYSDPERNAWRVHCLERPAPE